MSGRRPRAYAHILRVSGITAVAALFAWFVVPVFSGFYNEGFQMDIAINAQSLAQGQVQGTDLLYGLVDRFFLHSRFGVSVVLAGLLKLGLDPVGGFRLIMVLSLAGLLAANAAILVRRYGVHPALACLAALLFPGTFESAWFFNDNVLSAALSSTALLLFWTRPSLPRTAASALLLGLAVTCRTDAVLLAPAFLVLMWFELPDWPSRLRCALVAGPIVAAVPFLVYGAFGLHFLDILPLTRRTSLAWAREDPVSHMLHPALKGFSMPGLLVAGVGAVSILLRRQWREVIFCLVVPLVYAAAYGILLSEVRYLLPLTPFFGILVIAGLRALLDAAGWRATLGRTVLAGTVLLCVLPPVAPPARALWFLITDNDTLRPWIGRFWSPALSVWWNRKLERGFDAAEPAVLAAAAPGGLGVVVSTRWTPDQTVQLILREAHFTGARTAAPASCRDISEVFTHGDARLLHIRTHIPMLPQERALTTWQALAAPCLRDLGKAATDRVLVVGQTLIGSPVAGLQAPNVVASSAPVLDVHPWAEFIAGKSYAYFVATAPLADLPSLLAAPLTAPQTKKEQSDADWAVQHRDILQ